MNEFNQILNARLANLREQGLFRQLHRVDSAQGARIEIDGRSLVNFSSNDYLGLANHPALKEAAVRAVEQFGAGAGASRLICGSLAPFHKLEEALATFKATEAALTFSTGYAAAVGSITALLDKEDVIIVDKLIHASVVDAARLSGAKLRIFAHNDPSDLELILKWAATKHRIQHPDAKILIVTESIFSMDGDVAPLQDIVALKEKYGAWLMVDEAHATGLHGKSRRGIAEALGVSDQIEIQMGTLGKALGACGGYICGSRTLIDFLINRSRSFIFSTAPVPAAAAAALAGLKIVQSLEGEQRCQLLQARIQECKTCLPQRWDVGQNQNRTRIPPDASAIIPFIIGEETQAVSVSTALRQAGLFVPAIRYPTVARNSARLRITLSADHTSEDVAALVSKLTESIDRKS